MIVEIIDQKEIRISKSVKGKGSYLEWQFLFHNGGLSIWHAGAFDVKQPGSNAIAIAPRYVEEKINTAHNTRKPK